MPVDISYTPTIRLDPAQELKLAQPDTALYVGQVLKAVVVRSISDNEVLLTINGQNINAKTSHHLEPTEILQVKVLQTDGETVLQIMREPPTLTPIEAALAQTLPKQAPATHLLATLFSLEKMSSLPPEIRQQIQLILASVTNLNQLPGQLAQAIGQSGLFWEASLLQGIQERKNPNLQKDFKGQCLNLLGLLINAGANAPTHKSNTSIEQPGYNPLPLMAATPQPLPHLDPESFEGQTLNKILSTLRDQTEQVLARIKTSQLIHLLSAKQEPFYLMLDLPIKTNAGLDVIPLLIREHRPQSPGSHSDWSINFALNLSNLGGMQGRMKLISSAIDIQINAESKETIELLNHYQQGIDELLTAMGLNLRGWTLKIGLEEQEDSIDSHDLRLLDIRI